MEVELNNGCIEQTDRSTYFIWQHFTVSNSSEAKKVGAKIAACNFVTKPSVVDVLPKQQLTFWGALY